MEMKQTNKITLWIHMEQRSHERKQKRRISIVLNITLHEADVRPVTTKIRNISPERTE